eukprot:3995614-Amphidinium_carterae.1
MGAHEAANALGFSLPEVTEMAQPDEPALALPAQSGKPHGKLESQRGMQAGKGASVFAVSVSRIPPRPARHWLKPAQRKLCVSQ